MSAPTWIQVFLDVSRDDFQDAVTFWSAVTVTLTTITKAFVIALVAGVLTGYVLTRSKLAMRVIEPVLSGLFTIPITLFLPMFILIFGIGFEQKVAYAAFSTIFIVIMSATAAVESVKSDHVLVARSCGATRTQILLRIYVPSMMPVLLETLRISMIFNFTGVMIAEMYASRTGIGHLIANWGENFQMPQLFAGVIFGKDPFIQGKGIEFISKLLFEKLFPVFRKKYFCRLKTLQ